MLHKACRNEADVPLTRGCTRLPRSGTRLLGYNDHGSEGNTVRDIEDDLKGRDGSVSKRYGFFSVLGQKLRSERTVGNPGSRPIAWMTELRINAGMHPRMGAGEIGRG